MSTSGSILVANDHFYPAYKAGGPIQSLTNLISGLDQSVNCSVLTSAFDLNSKTALDKIAPNEWNRVLLGKKQIDVWYDKEGSNIGSVISQAKPDVIYLNGIYSYKFVLKPLLYCKRQNKNMKVVVCPRGMLQKGALSVKPLKKKIYFTVLRSSGLLKNVAWHATNEEEREDIRKVFGKGANVFIAPNIPKRPVQHPTMLQKEGGKLKLVYLSLISEKKNLLHAMEIVNGSDDAICLDIFGPVKDSYYWEKCKILLEKSNGRITYKGDVKPEEVQNVLSQYHALFLLTKGENFGHALYESLSVGRPLITSFFTPWNELEKKKAGWNVDISDSKDCVRQLEAIAGLSNEDFQPFCSGAFSLAESYYNNMNAIDKYKELFGIN